MKDKKIKKAAKHLLKFASVLELDPYRITEVLSDDLGVFGKDIEKELDDAMDEIKLKN